MALASKIKKLADGRAIVELDYSLAATFNDPETETFREKAAILNGKSGDKDRHFTKYRTAAQTATIPTAQRNRAEQLSRGLAEDFQTYRREWQTHQDSGRLDSRAFVRALEAGMTGRDPQETRPFKRLTTVAKNDPPTIAIVADYAWSIRCDDDTYEKRVGTLACSILWACETADLPCTFAAVRGDWKGAIHGTRSDRKSLIAVLAQPSRPMTAAAYAAAVGRDGQDAFIYAACYAGIFPSALNDDKGAPDGIDLPSSTSGAGGIAWAREIVGASFIVAIGNFERRERENADILLRSNAKPEDAIAQIRAALQIRKAA
jgi:hypothetical protein